MAAFYGSLYGNRGVTTRCGSKNSGIHTIAQSYDGSVKVDLDYDNDKLRIKIGTLGHSTGWTNTRFLGSLEELEYTLKLYRRLKSGEIEIKEVNKNVVSQ